jgi:hypothetical protein
MGSLSFWPFGTEYRISLTRPLAEKELKSLVELNALRGSVAVAFVDCELTQQELENATRHLDHCHLFQISNGQVIPWTSTINAEKTKSQ